LPVSPPALQTIKDFAPHGAPTAANGSTTTGLGKTYSGAIRRRFIGTLAGQRQARTRSMAGDRRKLLIRHDLSP